MFEERVGQKRRVIGESREVEKSMTYHTLDQELAHVKCSDKNY